MMNSVAGASPEITEQPTVYVCMGDAPQDDSAWIEAIYTDLDDAKAWLKSKGKYQLDYTIYVWKLNTYPFEAKWISIPPPPVTYSCGHPD
jgi:hypothetical protein